MQTPDKNMQMFDFYLTAVSYCRRNKIPLEQIKKVSFTQWEVVQKGKK